ncbi:hypothetical protein ABFX02_06G201805 [Erythranthe guttata]
MEIKINAIIQYTISITIIIISCLVPQNAAQVQRQQCMNQLQPCTNYLNSDKNPSESCCQNLDYVIKYMPECLCSLMSVQGANKAEQAGVNVAQAQTLPGRCGQHINPIGCVTGTPDKRSKNSAPESSDSVSISWSLTIVFVSAIAIFVTL